MRALIDGLKRFKGLVELFMLAAVLASWSGSVDSLRFDGGGGSGFTGGGFTGRPILSISISADKTEMPANLAGHSVDPSLPYTNTIAVQVKRDGRLFPAESLVIDLIEVSTGSLLYLDGDPEHQNDDGSPKAFRRLAFEDTSGVVTAHFTTGTQPGVATIIASTQDPSTGQVVSAQLKINVTTESRPATSLTFAGPYVNAVIAKQSRFGSPPLLDGTYSRVVSVVVNDGNGRPVNPNTRIDFFLFDAPLVGFPSSPGSFFIAGNNGDPVEGMYHFSAPGGDFFDKGVRVFYRLLLDGRLRANKPLPDNRYHTGVWRVNSVLTPNSLVVQTSENPFNSVPHPGAEVPLVPDNGATVPYIIGYAWYGTILSPSFTDVTGVASTLLTYPVERVGQTAILVACTENQEICDILNTCDASGQNCGSVYLGVTNGSDRVLTASESELGPNRSSTVRMCLRDVNFVPLRATEIRYDIGAKGGAKVIVNGTEGSGGSFLTGADGCSMVTIASSGQVPGSSPITLNFSADYVLLPVKMTIRSPGAGNLDGFINSCEFNPEEGTGKCNLTLRMTDSEGTPMSDVLIALGNVKAAGPFKITFDPAAGVFGRTDEAGQIDVTLELDSPGEYTFPFQTAAGGTAKYEFEVAVPGPGTLAVGFVGETSTALNVPYNALLQAQGGIPPYTWTLISGSLPPGVTLSEDGTVSGTPTEKGVFSFSVKAKDTKNATGYGAFTISVDEPDPLELEFTGSKNATLNAPYSAVVGAKNGTAPYSFSLLAGSLPPGLTLGSDGTISGAPTAVGAFAFSVLATDSNGVTGTGNFTITVDSTAPLEISFSGPDTGTVGVPFSAVMSATGGTPPYTWEVLAGGLPNGITLSSSGALTGTPASAGIFTVLIGTTDSNGVKGTSTVQITIDTEKAPEIQTESPLPDATPGKFYAVLLTATEGVLPYKWNLDLGSWPASLSLNPDTGALSGTPLLSELGTYSFVARVTDANGAFALKTFELTVGSTEPLKVSFNGSASGAVGKPYNAIFTAEGAAEPVVWSVSAGHLPDGVSLNPSTGALTGTPTNPGTYTFSIQATDSNGAKGTNTLTVTVDSAGAPTIETASPLPDATPGEFYAAILGATGGSPPYQWALEQGSLPASLSLASNGTLSGTPQASEQGVYTFIARVTDSAGEVARKVFQLTIGNGGTSPVPVGSIIVLADPPQLESSAQTPSNITAIVRDQNGILLEGATVIFSANNDGTLQVVRAVTDASGTATAILSTPGNKANRVITVTATTGGLQGTIDIPVAGTTITAAGPSSVVIGQIATVTFTLKDSAGNGIGGETLTLVSDPAGNTLNPPSPVTNNAGQATVQVTAATADGAGNISVTASALGAISTKVLQVVTDVFEFLVPDPNATPPDVCLSPPVNCNAPNVTPPQVLTVRLTSSGTPVPGQTVVFETTRGMLSAPTATTNAAGEATVTVSSNNAGPAVITASTTTTAGEPVEVQAQVNFVATNPTQMTLQAEPATISVNLPGNTEERSTITATVRDANFNLVKGVTVNFVLDDVTGGSISPASAVTNDFGQASTVYTAGTTSSALNGVKVDATVAGFAITESVTLTVAQRSLFITLGTGNEVVEPNPTTYELPYSVLVNDAAGLPVQNALVTLSILPVDFASTGLAAYRKGNYLPAPSPPPAWALNVTASCSNEDANQNGILDTGEDFNGNGRLDPGSVATVSSTSVTTNVGGYAFFNVVYAQEFANWVRVQLTARATVAGSEAIETAIFVLPVLAEDVNTEGVNPPGNPSPFGVVANCANPN